MFNIIGIVKRVFDIMNNAARTAVETVDTAIDAGFESAGDLFELKAGAYAGDFVIAAAEKMFKV